MKKIAKRANQGQNSYTTGCQGEESRGTNSTGSRTDKTRNKTNEKGLLLETVHKKGKQKRTDLRPEGEVWEGGGVLGGGRGGVGKGCPSRKEGGLVKPP